MDDEFSRVMARYPAVARPWGGIEPLGNAGGLSGSRLWRFESGLGTLLARAWPTDGPPHSAVEEIHGWLAEAGDLGFIPVPLRTIDGRTLSEHAGRLWEVTPWMPGEAELSQPPHATRVCAAFAALAAFHQRLAGHRRVGPSPGLRERYRESLAWLDGGFDEVRRLIGARPDDACAAAAREWIDRQRVSYVGWRLRLALDSAVPLQPCLRDARPEHILFTGGSVTGLVDFGAMGVETVAADLARLLAEWELDDPEARDQALTAYTVVRPLRPDETTLIEVFERSSAVLLGGRWVRWHFLDGRVFHDPEAVARGLAKGIARLTHKRERPWSARPEFRG